MSSDNKRHFKSERFRYASQVMLDPLSAKYILPSHCLLTGLSIGTSPMNRNLTLFRATQCMVHAPTNGGIGCFCKYQNEPYSTALVSWQPHADNKTLESISLRSRFNSSRFFAFRSGQRAKLPRCLAMSLGIITLESWQTYTPHPDDEHTHSLSSHWFSLQSLQSITHHHSSASSTPPESQRSGVPASHPPGGGSLRRWHVR